MPFANMPPMIRALQALALGTACLSAAPALARRALPAETMQAPLFQPAESLEGNFLAAYIAGAARDTAAAATFYRETLKEDPRNPELLERAFVSFLADGSMQEAFRAAERLAQRDKANGLAHLALGVRELRARQYVKARDHLNKGGPGRAADLTSTLLTAWSFAGAGDGKRALEIGRQAQGRAHLQRLPRLSCRSDRGLGRQHGRGRAAAESRLRRRRNRPCASWTPMRASNRAAGARTSALAAYTAFEGLLPRHPIVSDALLQLQAGKTLVPLVTSAQEGAAEVLYGLGSAGNQQGDELPAIVYLRLALYLDPDHALALVTLADIFERLKRVDRAIEVFNRIPDNSPVRQSADIQIGLGLEQLGKGEEAVKHLEGLMKERSDDIEVIMALGNVLRARKRYAEAAEVYTKAVERIGEPNRGHWTLFYFRGSAHERAKQWPKAEADLKKALELVPDAQPGGKSQVLNYLGYSWVDMGLNIDEAFAMLKRAIDLNPRDGMIIDSLGWAFYRLGRYEEAVRELEKAVELKPGDPVINDHLGDAYWRVGRKLEARFQWQHAKDSNPEPDDLAKIVDKLEKGIEQDKPAAAETERAEIKKNGG